MKKIIPKKLKVDRHSIFYQSRNLIFMEDFFIECSPGVSGDMLLGAFYDLGVPKNVIEQPLIDLGLTDLYNLDFRESKSCSIRGIKVKVENLDCCPTKGLEKH